MAKSGSSHFELFAEHECKDDKWNSEMKYKDDSTFWREIHHRRGHQGYNKDLFEQASLYLRNKIGRRWINSK